MRFSLQSLALCIVSTQIHSALAGPCKPLTTTGATVSTTLETSLTSVVEESTTLAANQDSYTTTLTEATTTTAAAEDSTTTLAETTTTAVAEESTTTLAETTTTAAPEPTLLSAVYEGTDSEIDTYQPFDGFVGTDSTGAVKASYALEAGTSRLYATLAGGVKKYCSTVIPDGSNYGFIFMKAADIASSSVHHYVTCVVDNNGLLTCQSEGGPTPIVWYLASNNKFYGNSDPNYDQDPLVRFKLVTF